MGTFTADGEPRSSSGRLSFWRRVREFAVPYSMIETATARRDAGDWAGACAAARVETDLDLRSLANSHGRELAAQVRADLRHLAPDLLRWHLPRIAPDGLLRPGLTIALARYGPARGEPVRGEPAGRVRGTASSVHLVVRTAPSWADAGQRISLALWDGPGTGSGTGAGTGIGTSTDTGTGTSTGTGTGARGHPHPRPSRRFRLDLHRHLWDVRRAGELRVRSGAARTPPPPDDPPPAAEHGCAVDRWAAEAAILLRAEGLEAGPVLVRLGGRRRLLLDLAELDLAELDLAELDLAELGREELDLAETEGRDGGVAGRITSVPRRADTRALPLLPDAATWVLPDLELLRAGLIEAGELHPLVASALEPAGAARTVATLPGLTGEPDRTEQPFVVECRGAPHRIGRVDGVLTPLDHGPDELRREELLAALTGTPLPCLQAVDKAHRRPDCLDGVRDRLLHGDTAGALTVVEGLLGRDAMLREGALRDALETAAQQRVAYGLFREGLADPAPRSADSYRDGRSEPAPRRTARHRSRPRHAARWR